MEFVHGLLLLVHNRYSLDRSYFDSEPLMATIYSPHAVFRFVFNEACVRANFPIVCGCLVVAHFCVIPKICVISAIVVEVNAVPLTVISVVGRHACLVMMSMSNFATLIPYASVRR